MTANIADAVPRLKRLIPRLRGKRIGVLGDLMLDRYLWGTASRLSPEAAVAVYRGEEIGRAGAFRLRQRSHHRRFCGPRSERRASVESSGVREAQDFEVVCLSRCASHRLQYKGSRFLRHAFTHGRKIY